MFICFDTEDDSKELLDAGKSGFDKQVTQIAAIAKSGQRFYSEGKDVKPFKKWLQQQPEKFIYALNIQYDLGNLFGDELDELDCTLVGGRLIKAVWGNKHFVDVYNLYQMSVATLAKCFGMEKGKFDARDKEYVFQDVKIIFQAIDFAYDFAAEFGLTTIPSTIGGLCIKVWKNLGGMNCHDSNPLSREAYYGGRVELFKHRNETKAIAYTDVNSLYPSAMLNEFPTELREWKDLENLPKFGVIKATVKAAKRAIGVLPYRDKDGRILYPYGEFTGTWTINEFQAALARGYECKKIVECWGTNEGSKPYAAFVLTCYDKRLKSKNTAEKTFFKLLMNNLYGRLGTGGVIGRTVYQNADNCDDGICFGAKVLVNYTMPLSPETNWCHAAYVTAYGRLRLLEFMEKIGIERMIYCDTDSTIFDCDKATEKNIPFKCSSELGEMKLEGFGVACETYAPKMYMTELDGKKEWKAKGVPKTLAELFITTGRADFNLPFKIREAIRFYDKSNSKRLSVWRNVEKFKRSVYDKKKRTGNRYLPLRIVPD
jgi:hypothetical protein